MPLPNTTFLLRNEKTDEPLAGIGVRLGSGSDPDLYRRRGPGGGVVLPFEGSNHDHSKEKRSATGETILLLCRAPSTRLLSLYRLE